MARHLEAWFSTRPESPPDVEAPPPGANVLSIARADDASTEVRVVRRPDGFLTFEIEAWTNFEDAGGGAHLQWYTFHPTAAVVTDSVERVVELAVLDARQRGLTVGPFEPIRR